MGLVFRQKRRLRLWLLLGAAAFAVASVGACGGDDDEPSSSAGPATQTQDPATDQPKASGGGSSRGWSVRGPALTGEVDQARAGLKAVERVYQSFDAAVDAGVAATDVPARDTVDAASGNESLDDVCDLMSEKAKHQTIVYAKRSAGLADVDWTCENATGLLLRRARQSGGLKRSLRTEVVGVNVDGARATASVRFGGKGAISTIPLIKEGDGWKLAASPSGEGGG